MNQFTSHFFYAVFCSNDPSRTTAHKGDLIVVPVMMARGWGGSHGYISCSLQRTRNRGLLPEKRFFSQRQKTAFAQMYPHDPLLSLASNFWLVFRIL